MLDLHIVPGPSVVSQPVSEIAAEAVRAAVLSAVGEVGRCEVPVRSFHDLGWDRIATEVAARCASTDGESLARGLGVLPAGALLERRRAELVEALGVVGQGDAPSLAGVHSVGEFVGRSLKDDILAPADLIAIGSTAAAAERVRDSLRTLTSRAPLFAAHADGLTPLPRLVAELKKSFDATGQVADDASPDLRRLRHRVSGLRDSIQSRLERILKSPRYEGILQEEFVTFRNDRYVVPVKAGERGDFPGIVHGQSNSGATLFVEPQELVSLNNELRVAQLDVDNEVRRILQRLTRSVARHAAELEANSDVLTYVDLTVAMSRLATDLRLHAITATHPNTRGSLLLRGLRHPVLALRELEGSLNVVANDVELPPAARALVISGPNTGGKTVTLKAIGLVALMVRAGMPLPVGMDSRFPVFERIFSDIGDEQTVERDLSTFSGHVRNIVSFLHRCDAGSLVLLDELFAGTDPEQGTALGRALLTELVERGCWVVVTTHLEGLKTLGLESDRYASASVGFDVEKLEPTYALRMGAPGSSYAMRIAARLGLPRRVVEAAETAMRGGFEMDRETLLIRLEEEHTRLADARATGEQRARDLELELETARRDREKLAARERENATAELRELRRDVERMRDELARQLRAASQAPATPGQAPVQNADADRVLEEARRISKAVEQRTREAEEKRRAEQQSHRVGVDVAKLVAGASVFVRPFGREGQVVEAPRPGERVLVQIGGMRASFTLDDLATGSGSTAVETRMATRTRSADYDGAAVSMTLDLRGANAEDALEQLDLYLDRAWRAGLPSATIIHGHGTGVLKRAIRQRLPKAPWIVSQRPGQREEGGDGVTMVEFKTRSADLDSE